MLGHYAWFSFLFFRQDDRAHHGNQQQDGGHFKGQEILAEQQPVQGPGEPAVVLTAASGLARPAVICRRWKSRKPASAQQDGGKHDRHGRCQGRTCPAGQVSPHPAA